MTTANAKAAAKDAATKAHPSFRELDRPVKLTPDNAPAWGSDVAAETLRALEIPYIALNPGASYRGFHDSIVNYLGNDTPQMLLCLHEESAVAIAHGYAKVTGKAMAAAVHSNVGLFHATMAIFNAWCDRMPIVVLGATGPVDAAKRRPWIDWIHTSRDQGAIVRNYTKWDDQPVLAGRDPRVDHPRDLDGEYRADGAGLHQPRRRAAGSQADRAAAADRRGALHARRDARAFARNGQGGSGAAQGRQASGDRGRPDVPQHGRLERARGAGRDAQRQGHHRPQVRRRLPDRPSAARRRAGRQRARPDGGRGAQERGRHPGARPDRPQRRAARRLRLRPADGQDHQCQRRLPHPQRLEHGLRGAAADRRADRLDVRPDGAGAARGARRRQGAEAGGREAEDRTLQAERRAAAGRRSRTGAQVGRRRPRRQPHPPAAVLERRHLGVPSSARLSGLGRRRRHRRRPRPDGRRRAGAQGLASGWSSASAATATT